MNNTTGLELTALSIAERVSAERSRICSGWWERRGRGIGCVIVDGCCNLRDAWRRDGVRAVLKDIAIVDFFRCMSLMLGSQT